MWSIRYHLNLTNITLHKLKILRKFATHYYSHTQHTQIVSSLFSIQTFYECRKKANEAAELVNNYNTTLKFLFHSLRRLILIEHRCTLVNIQVLIIKRSTYQYGANNEMIKLPSSEKALNRN